MSCIKHNFHSSISPFKAGIMICRHDLLYYHISQMAKRSILLKIKFRWHLHPGNEKEFVSLFGSVRKSAKIEKVVDCFVIGISYQQFSAFTYSKLSNGGFY
ncbi:hypothetical protein CUU64_17985 [Bacillus sp. V5-8f]|nr:hypothetical protein CUU64_17985 [Bacillus sp. V5-8f]